MPRHSKLSLSYFHYENPACTSVLPIRATYFTHLILLDLLIQIFFEQHNSLNSSRGFLQAPVTSSLPDTTTILCTRPWNTLRLCSSLRVTDTFTATQNRK